MRRAHRARDDREIAVGLLVFSVEMGRFCEASHSQVIKELIISTGALTFAQTCSCVAMRLGGIQYTAAEL